MSSNECASLSHIDDIRLKIQASLVNTDSGLDFLPENKLDEIFNDETIKGVIKDLDCDKDELLNLPNTIRDGGKRVLAMLIWQNRPDWIVKFRNSGFLDSRLPFEETDMMRLVGKFDGIELARRIQWTFCPYVFPKDMWEYHRQIDRRMILPFTGTERIGDGAFGEIEKMSISPSQQHLIDRGARTVQVARKRMKAREATLEYRREKSSIRLLNQLRHPNIISFLGSYSYGDDNFFLFHYVELDLWKFLHREQRYQDFQNDCTFYSALAGLASALSKTHNLDLNEAEHNIDLKAIGYHHDIRPPNILVSADTFILADFGLGKVKPEDAPSHTPYKPISGDYIAPECTDMDENPNTVNRAIDVWAFGCLLVEVVTYMVKGVQGIKQFRAKRMRPGRLPGWEDSGFYQPHGALKEEVRQWIDSLVRDHPDSGMTCQLLEVAVNALGPEPKDRPNMITVRQDLTILAMRKLFTTVQETLQKTCESQERLNPSAHRHLEDFRYAKARFAIWGNTLFFSKHRVSDIADVRSDEFIVVMRDLLTEAEKTDAQNAENEFGNGLLLRCIDRSWKLLPEPLRQLADAQWDQESKRIESIQQHSPDLQLVPSGHHSSSVEPDVVHHIKFEYERAVHAFKDDLPDSVPWNKILEIQSIADLYMVTTRIQEEQHLSSGLRNLSKIQPFLERLRGFTHAVSDTISEHQDVLAAIWGPIALLLQWTKNLDIAIDSLLDTIVEVEKRMPEFKGVHQNAETEEIILLFFKDLLSLYVEMLKPLSHSNWMHVFERLWPKHDAHIQEISRHVERLAILMRNEIRLEDVKQEQAFRSTALKEFKKREIVARKEEFNRIMTSFSPKRYDLALYHLTGHHYNGTSDWLFSDTRFSRWQLRGSGQDDRILWIKGLPGAGKTTLTSAVVNLLKEDAMVAFVFLTYKESETSALSTIQSLAFQLAEKRPELIEFICQATNENLRSDLAATSKLLSDLVIYAGPIYLVIDGIDEISEPERARLLEELLSLSQCCVQARIFLSSRPEADILQQLEHMVTTIQINEHNEASIERYVQVRSQQIFNQRKIFSSSQKQIVDLLLPLASRAKGMFLYARLVMGMVASMSDLSDIEEELKVLPESLDDAYRRIIYRLGKIKDTKKATRARRLLGWIASSSQPISIEEAHQALVVNPEKSNQVFNIVAKLDAVEMLGPIVETVGNYIHFVHFTAKEYIVSDHLGKPLINPISATLDLAVCCIGYICQDHHDPGLTHGELADKASSGQYSFHAFASKMWFELVCQYLRLADARDPPLQLIQSIQRMCDTRKEKDLGLDGQEVSKHGDLYEDAIGILKEKYLLLYELLRQVSHFRQYAYISTGTKSQDPGTNQSDPLSISITSQRIRRAIEEGVCNSPGADFQSPNPGAHEKCKAILRFYGPRPFRCKFQSCKFWQDGFQARSQRDKHERSHDILLQCDEPGCEFQEIGFLSKKMRQDHIKTAHSSTSAHVTQRCIDTKLLNPDEREAVLSGLMQKDQVEQVQEVLSTSPDVLRTNPVLLRKLRLIAASKGSADMLKLLDDWSGGQYLSLTPYDSRVYIEESIKSQNASSLRYFSWQLANDFFNLESIFRTRLRIKQRSTLTPLIISTNWPQGVEIWCEWAQRSLTSSSSRNLQLYIADQCLAAAASTHAGEKQLLYMWKKLRVISPGSRGSTSASSVLKKVARHCPSIPLAAHLLDMGAGINDRSKESEKTALHWAARHATAKGAEMMKFLLLRGADPEMYQQPLGSESRKNIRDEKGARGIHQYLEGKDWDELVEESKQARAQRKAVTDLVSEIEVQE